MLIGLMMVFGAIASPDPKSEAAAEPQYKSYKTHVPSVYEPKYTYPKPDYPTTYKPASYPSYTEPSYPEHKPTGPYPSPSYKKDYYCDPRTPPKCAYSYNATFCLKDYEYPEQEIQVEIIREVIKYEYIF